jgi:integrative and conjugative element protein (TIGR02256 family)
MDYLGEWHTHPEEKPIPSFLDISEWRKICSARKERMIFVIVGWTGNLWLGEGQGNNIIQTTQNGRETESNQ